LQLIDWLLSILMDAVNATFRNNVRRSIDDIFDYLMDTAPPGTNFGCPRLLVPTNYLLDSQRLAVDPIHV
jgi:hypothetical protein